MSPLATFALGTAFGLLLGNVQFIAIALWFERRWKRSKQ